MNEENDERKELEVVNGDGTELDISPAYEHLNDAIPEDTTENKPKNIIVPKEMSILHKEVKENDRKDENNTEDNNEKIDEN